MNRSERPKNISLSQEIELLDEKIAALVGERTQLLAKAAGSRKRKRVSIIDAGQEKRLWTIWSKAFEENGLDKANLRKLFLIINSLAYARAEQKDGKGRGAFCMYPRRQPLQIDIQGPRDTFQTRVAITLATHCSSAFTLNHFQSSDVNIELIKGLNQAGASLSWDRSSFKSQPSKEFSMDGKVVFCGSCTFNFYLLLCLGLVKPGQIKYTGDSSTKLLDLRSFQKFLPQLGARLTIIDPHANGLPVRLETAGHLPEDVEIPWDIDTTFILALAVTAPLFPKGLTLILKNEPLAKYVTDSIRQILDQFDITVHQEENRIAIPPRQPECKKSQVLIPIDRSLGSYLLALPFFREGKAYLRGQWVEGADPSLSITSLFTEFGITLTQTDKGIESSCEGRPDGVYVDISERELLFPLVTAMCLGVTKNATIKCGSLTSQLNYAEDFLNFLGIDYTIRDDRIDIRPTKSRSTPPADAWESPSPLWTVAYVMASFVIPGICLANPGELTAIWPDFWTTFNNLPRPQDAMRSTRPGPKKVPNEHKPKRIKITNQ
jgi:3-phosphoshikimate 1-carboxyvinyltransferase